MQCNGDPLGRVWQNNDPLKSQWTPVVPPLPLCAPPLLSSCSGGLIMKTEMLCQRYCTHAIPFTSLLRTSKPLTHQQDGKQGMHIRQLIQLEMLTPVSPSAAALWDKMGGRQGKEERRGEERERKLGDRERRREHFDNPEICPDACGWPYSNCFPNRWFVLDRHILLGLQTCSFSSAFSICQPINPLGFNHRAAKGNLHNYSWKIPRRCCMSVLTWSSSQSSLCRHTVAC